MLGTEEDERGEELAVEDVMAARMAASMASLEGVDCAVVIVVSGTDGRGWDGAVAVEEESEEDAFEAVVWGGGD